MESDASLSHMMDLHVRVLCLFFLAASLTRRSGASGPVIRCEPCDAAARLSCKPLPKDCAERVREPGCGCCMTCALSLGRRCGVYTARCGSGLTCQPQPGETKPLQALLLGLGNCANSSSSRMSLTVKPTPVVCKLTGMHFLDASARVHEKLYFIESRKNLVLFTYKLIYKPLAKS